MRAEPSEFEKLDLRCHALLADVPLHDVWAIPLTGGGPDRTMQDVLAVSPFRRPAGQNPAVRGLFALRRGLGWLFRWDREDPRTSSESYVHRLTDEDRDRSVVAPGTREGAFRLLYLFPAEVLLEARNATVHGFLAMALVPRPGGYLVYLAIYVKPVGRITAIYMGVIDPFRRLIVYPGITRQLQAAWSQAYG
jgi:hypothetical protein